nr:hypothetical protein BaRGS_035105 [Batillaria attramentaria]
MSTTLQRTFSSVCELCWALQQRAQKQEYPETPTSTVFYPEFELEQIRKSSKEKKNECSLRCASMTIDFAMSDIRL